MVLLELPEAESIKHCIGELRSSAKLDFTYFECITHSCCLTVKVHYKPISSGVCIKLVRLKALAFWLKSKASLVARSNPGTSILVRDSCLWVIAALPDNTPKSPVTSHLPVSCLF